MCGLCLGTLVMVSLPLLLDEDEPEEDSAHNQVLIGSRIH